MNALAMTHDTAVQMIDTSIVRVHQHGACITRNRRQSMGRSRRGLTSKIHAVVDTNGLPVQLGLTPGEAHENRPADKLLSRLKSGTMLLADRGYDADWYRDALQAKGITPCIPGRKSRKKTIKYDKRRYKRRNRIEIMFGRLKDWRRVATRYDRCPMAFLSAIALAATVIFWL